MRDETEDRKALPALRSGDGFDDVDVDDGDRAADDRDRIIQGTALKFKDAAWHDKDGLAPPDEPLLAVKVLALVQRWKGEKVVEKIVKQPSGTLPKLADLNARIPVKQWEKNLDGKPRPPWEHCVVLYLLCDATAEKFTYASATIGAHIAIEELKDRVTWMRKLRGGTVCPLVKLSAKPFKTKFGMRTRPHFAITGWCELGGNGDDAPKEIGGAGGQTIEHIEQEVEPADQAVAAPDSKQRQSAPVSKPGRPKLKERERGGVKRLQEPSFSEELDDEIRY
jgi:hypothetical protein